MLGKEQAVPKELIGNKELDFTIQPHDVPWAASQSPKFIWLQNEKVPHKTIKDMEVLTHKTTCSTSLH